MDIGCSLLSFVAADSARTMESSCRKRKRAGEAGEHEQNDVVGTQQVPLPAWVDLNGCNDTPLPPGWEQCLDLQSGKLYFVNAATQTRAFEDPRIAFKEQGITAKGGTCRLDLDTTLPSSATLHPKASMLGLPLPNHCNGFNPNSSHDTLATSANFLTAQFDTNLTAAATNFISSMAATVCLYCHTFVMVSRQSPHCPNCKNVCNMDVSVSSRKQ